MRQASVWMKRSHANLPSPTIEDEASFCQKNKVPAVQPQGQNGPGGTRMPCAGYKDAKIKPLNQTY